MSPFPSPIRNAAALVATSALLSAAPAPAAPGEQVARFAVTMSGSQVTTWHYHKPAGADEPCGYGAAGDGDQTVTVRTAQPLALEVMRTGRPAAIVMRLASTRVAASAHRSAELRALEPPPGECEPEVPVEGDCEVDCIPPPPDCGRRDGFVDLALGRARSADEPAGGKGRVHRLVVSASSWGWHADVLAPLAPGPSLDETYEDCVLFGVEEEAEGAIVPVAAGVGVRGLFDRRVRRIAVRGTATRCYGSSGVIPCGSPTGALSAKTIVAIELLLRRT